MKKWGALFCPIVILFFFVSFGYGAEIRIRILHVNDFHGFAEPHKPLGADEMLGGMAYLAFKVRELRNETPSLLLAAGDMIQGNNWANLFRGASAVELLNEMGFDAMVLGNHEFDFGQGELKKRVSEARFPVLGANIEGLEGIKPYVIKVFRGIRIGIVGLVAEDTPVITDPRNVAGLRFTSPLKTVEKYIRELRSQTDVLLVLSHMGYPMDRALAEKTEGIDVIVGGHSHTRLDKPVQVKKTVIVQAWEHGKALGVLDISLKDGKISRFNGRLEEISPRMGRAEAGALEIVEKYGRKVAVALSDKVGETEVDLDGERRNVRTKETNLGNLVADIMRQTAGADVAIINGGAIRTSIGRGEIRLKDIYTALAFDNYIVAIRLTGRQIMEALEHGVSAVAEQAGRFPQVSGLAFKFSPAEAAGKRVKEASIAGRPIDMEREYRVATNDFLAVGGDGYKSFGEAITGTKDFSSLGGAIAGPKVAYSDAGRWLRDVVADYIKGQGKIAPRVEGRIVEVR